MRPERTTDRIQVRHDSTATIQMCADDESVVTLECDDGNLIICCHRNDCVRFDGLGAAALREAISCYARHSSFSALKPGSGGEYVGKRMLLRREPHNESIVAVVAILGSQAAVIGYDDWDQVAGDLGVEPKVAKLEVVSRMSLCAVPIVPPPPESDVAKRLFKDVSARQNGHREYRVNMLDNGEVQMVHEPSETRYRIKIEREDQ